MIPFRVWLWFVVLCLSVVSCRFEWNTTYLNNDFPIISSSYPLNEGGSVFRYNYNAAYLPLFNLTVGEQIMSDGLLVRVQNLQNESDPYSVGPSKIAFCVRNDGHFNPQNIVFSGLTDANVVIQPSSSEDALGTEDPRVVFDFHSHIYYLMYTAVASNSDGSVSAYLSLATSTNPTSPTGWEKHGYLFPQLSWSKSGALLILPQPPSLLFWGDSTLVPGLQVAKTYDLLTYEYNETIWLPVRKNFFDSVLVEAGPMPLKLSDGNYLFLYNSARCCFPSAKPNWELQYNVGWCILDGNNPMTILHRSDFPLLSPDMEWESGSGNATLSLTPNVVFVEGWQRYPHSLSLNHFLLYLGGADSVVGTVELKVNIVDFLTYSFTVSYN
jgi:predicted GH43/DUF377 family glycosyl hydrolase